MHIKACDIGRAKRLDYDYVRLDHTLAWQILIAGDCVDCWRVSQNRLSRCTTKSNEKCHTNRLGNQWWVSGWTKKKKQNKMTCRTTNGERKWVRDTKPEINYKSMMCGWATLLQHQYDTYRYMCYALRSINFLRRVNMFFFCLFFVFGVHRWDQHIQYYEAKQRKVYTATLWCICMWDRSVVWCEKSAATVQFPCSRSCVQYVQWLWNISLYTTLYYYYYYLLLRCACVQLVCVTWYSFSGLLYTIAAKFVCPCYF